MSVLFDWGMRGLNSNEDFVEGASRHRVNRHRFRFRMRRANARGLNRPRTDEFSRTSQSLNRSTRGPSRGELFLLPLGRHQNLEIEQIGALVAVSVLDDRKVDELGLEGVLEDVVRPGESLLQVSE